MPRRPSAPPTPVAAAAGGIDDWLLGKLFGRR
jgi:hypothetical protein